MYSKSVILLHGFLSSSNSSKAGFLRERFTGMPEVSFHAIDFNPTPRDFEYLTVTGMINRLRQYVLDHRLEDVRLIGSSMGALVGIHYAKWFGDIKRMLLLAPALSYSALGGEERRTWKKEKTMEFEHFGFGKELPLKYEIQTDGFRYQSPIDPSTSILILHGVRDDVVPIELSRAYAAAYPEKVKLVEVDSDHRLENQLEEIWGFVNSFLLG
jgi:pimeloyl-ACP methyl ester carboxylesterase